MVGQPEAVVRLQAQARCVRSPLAGSGGAIVWHVWADRRGGHAPLVLLHGGSGSWTHWLRNIEALASSGREVWAVDLPGFGDSAAVPGAQDVDALLPALLASLRSVVPGAPCDLVGFSFGAMAAGLLQAARPGLARSLVLVGAPGMTTTRPNRVDLRGWRHLPELSAQLAVHRHNLAAMMFADAARIDEAALQLHARNAERDRLTRRRLSNTDILARALERVACPVHAIYGEHDALYRGRFAELRAAWAASARDFRGLHLLEGVGHWAPYEQAPAFNQLLLQLLDAPAP
ncbi:alpha/beta fold hydrolase [Comamonas flocculans]|uniref:Alpha/beta fold hydrolase n=1 Tax=Comamonas flocculans TaxID=2597701 RepID=A0A5B8RV85_9BURK|nr:alpha/beta fold hydrolase [Comamonas flocculans]QEA13519.1 alpha/beta fold hydrolase [Comamonas flocculans]